MCACSMTMWRTITILTWAAGILMSYEYIYMLQMMFSHQQDHKDTRNMIFAPFCVVQRDLTTQVLRECLNWLP